jgi:hypothetical protein
MIWWPGSIPTEAGTRNVAKSAARETGWSGSAHPVAALVAPLRTGRSMLPDEDAIPFPQDDSPLLERANRRFSRSTAV